jgi:hypothetical protein
MAVDKRMLERIVVTRRNNYGLVWLGCCRCRGIEMFIARVDSFSVEKVSWAPRIFHC